jgi:hypothetical protein
MASNKKWFKRAYRSLASGNSQAWEMLKRKLPPSSVALLESSLPHMLTPEPEVQEAQEVIVQPPPKPSKPSVSKKAKTSKAKTTTKARKAKSKTNEKSVK